MEDLYTPNSQSKVYLEIVEKLRRMIEADGLVAGDKIPSERELSERLNVGRSSVREALRALELLGLIETRRGEGTYIRDFQEHRLVELLGAFFLLDEETKSNLKETKMLLELSCIRVLLLKSETEDIVKLEYWAKHNEWDDELFFQKVFQMNPNHLLERIWIVVKSYEKASNQNNITAPKQYYLELIEALKTRNEKQAIEVFTNKIRNLSIIS